VQEKGALAEGGFESGGAFDDGDFGETGGEHFFNAVVHFAGPEADFHVREVFFQES
jgi:hypothetical protein